MRWLIWGVTLVLLAIWTGTAAIAAAVADWLASQGTGALEGLRNSAAIELPAWAQTWLALVLPTEVLQALTQTISTSMDGVLAGWPWLSSALGWLATLVWVVWGIGAVIAVLCALALHWIGSRLLSNKPAPKAYAG